MSRRIPKGKLNQIKSWLIPLPKEPRVVYSDEDVIVAFKPSGYHTVNVGHKPQRTLVNWFAETHPEVMNVQGRSKGDGGVVHRLDGATAGLVLAVRSQRALTQILSDPPFLKHYFAIARFDPGAGMIPEVPIWPSSVDQTPMHWYERICNLPIGYHSSSAYSFDIASQFAPFGPKGARVKVVEAVQGKIDKLARPSEGENPTYISHCSLVAKLDPQTLAFKVSLEKGFRHQVRAHLSYLGCPVLEDPLYPIPHGNPALPSAETLLQEIGLYATGIDFVHPTTRKRVSVTMPQFESMSL